MNPGRQEVGGTCRRPPSGTRSSRAPGTARPGSRPLGGGGGGGGEKE